MKQQSFPFSALLGQQAMQTALLINAVDPGIGGVLIRGQKGTGKSTAARALADLLPAIRVVTNCPYHCPPDRPELMHDGCRERYAAAGVLPQATEPTPFVDLPLSAGEDRLVGTLHLGRTLETGERHFEPGLLAAANRGILYVDEVNLLPDHLVDQLLDVAASGLNIVEREGLRIVHPARFLLIGTMNPEEGDLRPQFLDRFGLCVSISGMTDLQQRREIVARRLAFDQDAAAFGKLWQDEEVRLAAHIAAARSHLYEVEIPAQILDHAVTLAAAAKVQGHRADLALIRTARALAALLEQNTVRLNDLAEAAQFTLPHRLGKSLAETPEASAKAIQTLLAENLAISRVSDKATPLDDELLYLDDSLGFPGAAAAGSSLFAHLKKKRPSAVSKQKKPST